MELDPQSILDKTFDKSKTFKHLVLYVEYKESYLIKYKVITLQEILLH
jgi:hypothetical protein